jgi:phosphoadenosine phosphosulfate reductase
MNHIEKSIMRLKEFEPPEGYYLAFSGGKDSCVLKALADMAGVKYDAHYNWTTVDPPELVRFIREQHPDVVFERPKLTMFQLIKKKKFPPTRKARYCCAELKERGGEGRMVLTGVRWEESVKRRNQPMVEKGKRKGLKPIIDWGCDQIWQFIRDNNIPYCSLYDTGFYRLGCVLCPMAGKYQRKKEAIRWPKIYKAYLHTLKYCVKHNDQKRDWSTPEKVMRWWLELDYNEEVFPEDDEMPLFSQWVSSPPRPGKNNQKERS